GVWVEVAMLPLMIAGFRSIHRHYEQVAVQLMPDPLAAVAADGAAARADGVEFDGFGPTPTTKVVLLVDALDEAAAMALGYARSFAGRDVETVYVGEPDRWRQVEARWPGFCRGDLPMRHLEPGERTVEATLAYLRSVPRDGADFLTVVIPERFSEASLTAAVRHRTAFALKLRLLSEP